VSLYYDIKYLGNINYSVFKIAEFSKAYIITIPVLDRTDLDMDQVKNYLQ